MRQSCECGRRDGEAAKVVVILNVAEVTRSGQSREHGGSMKFSWRRGLGFLALVGLLIGAETAAAQSAASREYMEASSPLKKGGVVVTRTAPGQQVETVIYRETPSLVRTIAVVERPIETQGTPPQVAATQPGSDVSVAPPPDLYPYPQPIPSLNQGIFPSVMQVPSLGYSGTTAQRPSWFGQPTQRPGWFANRNSPQFNNPAQFNNTPQFTGTQPFNQPFVQPPPADTAPMIQYPQAYQPGQMVTAASPQWTQPFTASQQMPQPMVRFQNMPPGSYMGQGIVGQPKAYVDGQPMRNLFRYLTPF